MTIFKHEKISPAVTRIYGLTEEMMYLLEGNEKAALIDTGCGIGSLRKYIETITDKPIVVFLTHGHVDHAMGAPEFDEVYMNSSDNEIFNKHKSYEVRYDYIKMSLAGNIPPIEEHNYVKLVKPDFKELKDGMVFDLGGINLEFYNTPGHTQGCMTVLIREERVLLLGDACNTFTFLFDDCVLSIEEYKGVLLKLDSLTRGKYDKVYLSHGLGDASKDMLSSVIDVCDDIMLGKADDVPFYFMGQQAFLAKEVGEDKIRVDGGLGNIVYNKNKVFMGKKLFSS